MQERFAIKNKSQQVFMNQLIRPAADKSELIRYDGYGYHPIIPGLFIYKPKADSNIIGLEYLQSARFKERTSDDYLV